MPTRASSADQPGEQRPGSVSEHLRRALHRMRGAAPLGGGPWSWTTGALARDAMGEPCDPCASEARSWDLLGALQVEWCGYPEGFERDCVKRTLYCVVSAAARHVEERWCSLSRLNDEEGWQRVHDVLLLAFFARLAVPTREQVLFMGGRYQRLPDGTQVWGPHPRSSAYPEGT